MIRHFFLDKTATIIKGSLANTGLNPILSLNYGGCISRGVLHFDEKQIKQWVCEEGLTIGEHLTFKLKMTNCFSVDGLPYEKKLAHTPGGSADRAASFDLVLFRLNQDFDAGRGFDYESDMWCGPAKSYSESGVNWKYCSGLTEWNTTGAYEPDSDMAVMHFDFGNENIDIDITDYVIDILDGVEENHGLGIKFADEFEQNKNIEHKEVSFFTDNTNTFFHPVIEAVYDDYISDDRESVCKGKNNRLYIYTNTENGPTNLDELPTCDIEGVEHSVVQAARGVYYVELPAVSISSLNAPVMIYDTWRNIRINGVQLADVEMEAPVLPESRFIQAGNKSTFKIMTVPDVYGINENEALTRGEVREVIVDFRRKYTTDKKELTDTAEWRLYSMDNDKEVPVFDYQPVEKAFLNNFFVIHTEDLIPGEYYIDIKNTHGREVRYFTKVLMFKVESNLKERYN